MHGILFLLQQTSDSFFALVRIYSPRRFGAPELQRFKRASAWRMLQKEYGTWVMQDGAGNRGTPETLHPSRVPRDSRFFY
jgi:hypothetical protein